MVVQSEVYRPDTAERRWSEMEGRFLNHVELLYRPGERALVGKLFTLLGCKVTDSGGKWLSIKVDGREQDYSNNTFYASEVTPEQWAFEQAVQQAASEGALAAARAELEARRKRTPQEVGHFGIRMSVQEQADIIARIEALEDPELKGRVEVARVFRPEDPDSVAPGMIQAFVRTDVVSVAMTTLGQMIELQVVVS